MTEQKGPATNVGPGEASRNALSEPMPTAEERRAWRAEKSSSFPEFWKKKLERRELRHGWLGK